MSFNLSAIITENVRRQPNNIAVIDENRRLSYSDLLDGMKRFKNMVHHLTLKPGDKIAILMPNCLEYPVTYFGILYSGCVAVPLNILLSENEIAYHLKDSDTSAIIVAESLLSKVEKAVKEAPYCGQIIVIKEKENDFPLPESSTSFHDGLQKSSNSAQIYPTRAEDPAAIIYTSGTTGKPKGAMLSHFNLFMNAYSVVLAYGEIGPGDVGITALPLYQSGGMTLSMNTILYSGAAMTIMSKFDPEKALHLIKRDNVSFFAGVPTMYIQLLGFNKKQISVLKNLKLGLSAGAPLPIEILNTYRNDFEVKALLEAYGLTECSPGVTFQHAGRKIKHGSIGEALWGLDVGIMNNKGELLPSGEDGEIVVRGHSVMLGYYKKPEATQETIIDNWLHTGDIGNYDDEGHFYFAGRIKEMIIRGGYNVYPKEVEDVLYKIDGILEASVVGIDDNVMGEEICACLVVRPESGITEQSVINYCKQQLAKYKYPRKVFFYDELPKNSTGKILKRNLIKSIQKI
jgi:long-chain acyl-CoA synthetase